MSTSIGKCSQAPRRGPWAKSGRGSARRGGQVLVEFSLVFMAFLLVFFAIIEFSRALNVLVTLNTIASASARRGAMDDPTLSVNNSDVTSIVMEEFRRYAYLDPSRLTVSTNVNRVTTGSVFQTEVTLTYDVGTLIMPVPVPIVLRVSSKKSNAVQMQRPP